MSPGRSRRILRVDPADRRLRVEPVAVGGTSA